VPRLASLLRNLFRRKRIECELDEELRAYVDMTVDEKRRGGLADADARRQALAELGGVEQVKERVRDVRAGALLDQLRQDLSYAFRTLRKSPVFTAVAVATLALGIGATTAVFSMVDTLVFRPLPYTDPGRLVKICGTGPRDPACNDDLSAHELDSIQRAATAFAQVAADDGMGVTVVHADGTRASIGVGLVSTNWLSTLGVKPIIGRDFHADEGRRGRDGVLILTHNYWTKHFGAGADAIGRTLTFDGSTHIVVGVLPPNVLRYYADVLKPLVLDAYTDRSLDIFGRLKPGATLAQIGVEVDGIGRQLARDYPGTNGDRQLSTALLDRNYAPVGRREAGGLLAMLGAVALVLVVACTNVANLLLARAGVRRRESVVRAALGASRGRLVRQALVESILLFAIGGAAGVIVARLFVDSLTGLAISGGYMPERMSVSLDLRVLGVAMGLSLLTGLLFGMIPALQASRVDVNAALRASAQTSTGDRRRGRTRRVLIVAEVALSLVLLAGSGLLIRSFARLYAASGGYSPDNVVVIASDGGRSFPEAMLFWNAALDRARALPGVASAALTSRPPANDVRSKPFEIEGRPVASEPNAPLADDVFVSGAFFETLRIPLLRGRTFAAADSDSAPKVAVISESFARRFFDGENPLGRRIRMVEKLPMPCCAVPGPVEGVWREIVGVVGDVRQDNLDEPPSMTVYRPVTQIVEHDMVLVVRASDAAAAGRITRELRSHLLGVDRARDWTAAQPMWQMIRDSGALRLRRFVVILLGVFAALALLLAAVGVYGVASSGVAERTREIGIRIALGASRPAVFRQIVGEMALLALAGSALGVVAAFPLTRVIESMLFDTSATDPLTYVGVALLLGAMVVAASWIPARKATRIDPLIALRHE